MVTVNKLLGLKICVTFLTLCLAHMRSGYSNSCKNFPFSLAGPGLVLRSFLYYEVSKLSFRVSLTRFRRDGSSLPGVALAKKNCILFKFVSYMQLDPKCRRSDNDVKHEVKYFVTNARRNLGGGKENAEFFFFTIIIITQTAE